MEAMSKPGSTKRLLGSANNSDQLIDQLQFLRRAERARERSDQAGDLFGLYFLYIEKQGMTNYSGLNDELSLVARMDAVDWMTWLDSQTAVMTVEMNNESRLVTHAVNLHQYLEGLAQDNPTLRHYLGVSVSLGGKDSIDAMISRAAMASAEGFRAESSHQTGTVRFSK